MRQKPKVNFDCGGGRRKRQALHPHVSPDSFFIFATSEFRHPFCPFVKFLKTSLRGCVAMATHDNVCLGGSVCACVKGMPEPATHGAVILHLSSRATPHPTPLSHLLCRLTRNHSNLAAASQPSITRTRLAGSGAEGITMQIPASRFTGFCCRLQPRLCSPWERSDFPPGSLWRSPRGTLVPPCP